MVDGETDLLTLRRRGLDRDGFAVVHDWISATQVNQWRAIVERALASGDHVMARGEHRAFARRNLARTESVFHCGDAMRDFLDLVKPLLGTATPRLVRAILFDKHAETNWSVAWHQDLSIPVAARHDVLGWQGWSVKAGVVHVQPPVAILEGMLTVRLHLDDCDRTQGPLRVIPGTHRLGRLGDDELARVTGASPAVDCTGSAGSAVLMRPLVVHGSSRAESPRQRRVLHCEFTSVELPFPFEWALA